MTGFDQIVAAPPGRFDGIERPYSAEDVLRLRGSIPIEHTFARRGALKLWQLLQQDEPVRALGALSGNQAMQMVRAGLQAIYLSGWQVAADSNVSGSMYPDQSLYPANSGPELARKINKTLQRADPDRACEGGASATGSRRSLPTRSRLRRPAQLLRDHEGLYRGGRRGRSLRGPARVEKKCGHLGGKVLIPTQAHIRNLMRRA
jgi:isocitrate lyase